MKPVSPRAQRGAVLIVALLFLTILTILGVTAMTTTTFEERMAGNTRDVSLAFQAAEAALRDARRDLNGITILPFNTPRNPAIKLKTGFGDGTDTNNATCGKSKVAVPQTLGLCRSGAYDGEKGVQPPMNNSTTIWQDPPPGIDSSVEFGTYTGALIPAGMLARRPRYFIEVLCYQLSGAFSLGGAPAEPCAFYRITARGWGANINTQVTLQEIFLKP